MEKLGIINNYGNIEYSVAGKRIELKEVMIVVGKIKKKFRVSEDGYSTRSGMGESICSDDYSIKIKNELGICEARSLYELSDNKKIKIFAIKYKEKEPQPEPVYRRHITK